MAQKDIESIAKAMREAEEELKQNDRVYERSQRELARMQAEEDAEYEDEIIKPEDIGMIDSSEEADESDDFYNEDEFDPFEEPVSDCLPASEAEDVDEAEGLASIVVDVYIEDGEENDFVQKVMKTVPGVVAKQKSRPLPNGDMVVTISGNVDDLRKAWAFYNGFKTFGELPQDFKREFDSLLVFDDGDTISEAEWRKDVAHCLDAADMPPSTANLASDKESIMSLVKEERERRSKAKIEEALKTKDLSQLSDSELDKLSDMAEAEVETKDEDNVFLKDPASLDQNQHEFLLMMLKHMGYTEDQWSSFSVEERRTAYDQYIARTHHSRDEFMKWLDKNLPKEVHGFYPVDDKVGSVAKGEEFVTAYNPNMDADAAWSHRHTSDPEHDAVIDAKKYIEDLKKDIEHFTPIVQKKLRGKDTLDVGDMYYITAQLSDRERKAMLDEMIADVKRKVKGQRRQAEIIYIIKMMFGERPVISDLMSTLGVSKGTVKNFQNSFETCLHAAMLAAECHDDSVEEFNELLVDPDNSRWEKFINAFKEWILRWRKGQLGGHPDKIDPKNTNANINEPYDDTEYFASK